MGRGSPSFGRNSLSLTMGKNSGGVGDNDFIASKAGISPAPTQTHARRFTQTSEPGIGESD